MFGGSPEGGGSHFARMADGDLVFRLPDHVLRGAEVVPFHEDLAVRSWEKAAKPAEEPKPPLEPKPPEAPEVPK